MSAGIDRRRKGLSLAKGPIAIVGMVGIAMGVCGLIFGGHGFHLADVPHGSIYGKRWLGIELNGWTNLLFIAAGLFLLLFSPAHWGAKAAAWIVAGVLGAAAVIAVIRGNGIFGIFAADHRTEIVWGAAAVVLLVLSLLPRVGGGRTAPVERSSRRGEAVAARRESAAGRDRDVTRDESAVARSDREAAPDRPVVTRTERVETPEQTATDRQPATTGEHLDDVASDDEQPETTQQEPIAAPERPAIVERESANRGPGRPHDEPAVTESDADTPSGERRTSHDDDLVSPRDEPPADSDEPTGRS
jgi:hypothetical protein